MSPHRGVRLMVCVDDHAWGPPLLRCTFGIAGAAIESALLNVLGKAGKQPLVKLDLGAEMQKAGLDKLYHAEVCEHECASRLTSE